MTWPKRSPPLIRTTRDDQDQGTAGRADHAEQGRQARRRRIPRAQRRGRPHRPNCFAGSRYRVGIALHCSLSPPPPAATARGRCCRVATAGRRVARPVVSRLHRRSGDRHVQPSGFHRRCGSVSLSNDVAKVATPAPAELDVVMRSPFSGRPSRPGAISHGTGLAEE